MTPPPSPPTVERFPTLCHTPHLHCGVHPALRPTPLLHCDEFLFFCSKCRAYAPLHFLLVFYFIFFPSSGGGGGFQVQESHPNAIFCFIYLSFFLPMCSGCAPMHFLFYVCVFFPISLGSRDGRESRDQNTITTASPPILAHNAFPR